MAPTWCTHLFPISGAIAESMAHDPERPAEHWEPLMTYNRHGNPAATMIPRARRDRPGRGREDRSSTRSGRAPHRDRCPIRNGRVGGDRSVLDGGDLELPSLVRLPQPRGAVVELRRGRGHAPASLRAGAARLEVQRVSERCRMPSSRLFDCILPSQYWRSAFESARLPLRTANLTALAGGVSVWSANTPKTSWWK